MAAPDDITPPEAAARAGEPAAGRATPAAVHCVRCAYHLVGLPENGVCPECGTPIEHSLRGHLLTYAAPAYVRAIGQGLSLVLAGFGTLGVFATLFVWTHSNQRYTPARGMALEAVYALAVLLILLGYLRYSAPDPGYAGREDPVTARRVLRWSSAAMLTLALGALVMRMYGLPTGLGALGAITAYDSPAFPGALVMAGILCAVCVQYFAVLRYTAWLGRRVPDLFIVAKARRYRWVLPLMPLWGLAPAAISYALRPDGGFIICCTVCTLPLAVFIAALMFVALLWRMQAHARSILQTGRPAPMDGMAPSSDMRW